MREISCRAFDMLFVELRKKGLPPEVLAEGSGYPVEHLRNKRERIEWPAFVRINGNAGKIWNENELTEMGGAFLRSPVVRAIMLPARLLLTPRDLYKWVFGSSEGLGKQLFPMAKNRYEELSPISSRLELTVPDDYENCPEFFVITRGALADFPRVLGSRRAGVAMSWIPHGARYDIDIPEVDRILPRAWRAIAAPFNAVSVAREAKEAHAELKVRHAELEDYRLNLEKKVEDRTAELAATVRQLEEAQAARNLLFANINHEIRTPISNMTLAVTRLRKRMPEGTGRAEIDTVDAAGRRLLRLVDGLLVLAAGQEKRLRLQISPRDLSNVVRGVVHEFGSVADQRGIRLHYDGPERCVAPVDAHAVERILANLLSNAVKFTPTGGSIEVRLTEGKTNLEVSVRDTGIGIDDEFKKRIFGRFEQGRPSVHAGAHGSGLGLSIVKELAEGHGGSVGVESPSNGGSLFRVSFPRVSAIPLASTEPEAPGEPGLRLLPSDFGVGEAPKAEQEIVTARGTAEATILVAEDDATLRAAITELLSESFKVVVAHDGMQALTLAKKHLPDMLVSDVGMPGLDGFELTQRFRAIEGIRLAPVLLLTAFAGTRERLKGFDAGAVDYVLKPFDPSELLARVRAQLALRAMALRLHETEKLAALGILSAGLAHELRNPANGIVNALEPLVDSLPPELSAPDRPSGMLLKVVRDCAAQISALSRQLLSIRRPGELATSPEAAGTLVDRALTVASPALEGVTIQDEREYMGSVECAAPLVVQVFCNLLENAAQAAGKGGTVRIRTSSADGFLVVEVGDSGPGVPVELREKIFEPFFTTKDPGKGTGLGLTTAREIISRHHGSLEVKPSGEKTVFQVRVPLLAGNRDAVAATGHRRAAH